jgi:hypothetical protein
MDDDDDPKDDQGSGLGVWKGKMSSRQRYKQ